MLKTGLVQIYTGEGPYPNFAPFGLALRAAGQGFRTHLVCFAEHRLLAAAPAAALRLSPQLSIDRPKAPVDGASTGVFHKAALSSYRAAERHALSGGCDILILDGVSTLFEDGIVEPREVLSLIDSRRSHVEVVLGGFALPEVLLERADLVTEMAVFEQKDPGHGSRPSDPQGPIEVVTGNGKGKTTYCLGKALLMSCLGIRTAFLQFMKSPQAYGEVKAIRRLPGLGIKTMGAGFLMDNTPEARKTHLDAARRAWEHCLREIFSLKYGLVVLDEINTATYYGLVNPERVREMLFLKPSGLHMLLSGRNAHLEVIAYATRVIEMREIKHPYHRGIKARRGIEF